MSPSTIDKKFEIYTFFENTTEIRNFFDNRTEIYTFLENRFEIYTGILFENRTEIFEYFVNSHIIWASPESRNWTYFIVLKEMTLKFLCITFKTLLKRFEMQKQLR